MSAAAPGNDRRLGGYEAPPAVISIFLGSALTSLLENIAQGGGPIGGKGEELFGDVDTLPTIRQDDSDRNRTSPFAFTGNKFEFRAVGSSASIAQANYVLNTIVAESLDEFCTRLEKAGDFDAEVRAIVADTVRDHGRVIFNGNNYTGEWQKLARERGLPNLDNTVDAAAALLLPKSLGVLEKYHVLSRIECESRYEIRLENYAKVVIIEANTLLEMIRRQVLPAVIAFSGKCADTYNGFIRSGIENKSLKTLLLKLSRCISDISDSASGLEAMMKHTHAIEGKKDLAVYCRDRVIPQMNILRGVADSAESCVSSEDWPMPSYTDLLHRV